MEKLVELDPAEAALLAAEALDLGLIVRDRATGAVYMNAAARNLLGLAPDTRELPEPLREAIGTMAEGSVGLTWGPPESRVRLRIGRRAPPQGWDVEVLVVRRDSLRDEELRRVLGTRYGVTDREYHALQLVRRGQSNRQIGIELGITEHGVAKLVARLLERFDAPNRTTLAQHVERVASLRSG